MWWIFAVASAAKVATSGLAGVFSEDQGQSASFDDRSPVCDVSTDSAICLGDSMIMAAATQTGLIGHWSFDDTRPIDGSGKGNHAIGSVEVGMSFSTRGASGKFHSSFLTVPHSVDFESKDFGLSLWLFLQQGKTDADCDNAKQKWCPLLRKGISDEPARQFTNAPAVLYDRCEQKLKVVLSTTSNEGESGEFVISHARLRRHQWTHIAVARVDGERSLKLYVNGILDSHAVTKGSTVVNKLPLYIGNDPWAQGICTAAMLMDELRFYNRPLTSDEIAAEAAPALGGVDPHFLRLGCMDCSLEQAATACSEGYHMCTSMELHSGGYQVARAMGWLSKKSHVWTRSAVEAHPAALLQGSSKTTLPAGLGLCCEAV
mmetsp:Transcript_18469/g.47359  ORF Transcript_18469/g.47359 Transcript_18469/m.47359 type:complete len:374 (+) Transcript_18469:90-1211(+)